MSGKLGVANQRRVRGASDMTGRGWRKCKCGKKATKMMVKERGSIVLACDECARRIDEEWFAKLLANRFVIPYQGKDGNNMLTVSCECQKGQTT